MTLEQLKEEISICQGLADKAQALMIEAAGFKRKGKFLDQRNERDYWLARIEYFKSKIAACKNEGDDRI